MLKTLIIATAFLLSAKTFGFEADQQKELIKAAISAHSDQIRMCYRDNEKKLKGVKGKMVIDFEINDQGALTKSGINEKKSILKNEILMDCISEKAKAWVFPAAPKGQVLSISYPFVFKKN